MAAESEKKIAGEDRSGQIDPIQRGNSGAAQAAQDLIGEQMDRFLTFDSLNGEQDADLDLEQLAAKQNHPFANYPVRTIRQRIYPRNPILDSLDTAGLIEYCRVHEMFHPQKMIVEIQAEKNNPQVKHKKIVKCTLDKPALLKFIDEKETWTFPSYAVVFCEYRKKKGVPHSRAIRSFVDNRFYDVVFDKRWVFKDGKVRRGFFAIVEDHTVRCQLLFRYHPKKRGKLVVDKRYSFLKGDIEQLNPLKEVFLICQKSRKAIVEAGIASSGDQAEKELMGNEAEVTA